MRDKINAANQRLASEDYHAHPALSFSQLLAMGTEANPTPSKLMRAAKLEASDALTMGTLAHTAWLEPHLLDNVAVRPVDINGRCIASNTKAYGQFLLANEGKLIVHPDMIDTMRSIIDTLDTVPVVKIYRAAFDVVCCEGSFFWTDEETGIECRIRPDALLIHADGTVINEDLKTCEDPSPYEFRYHAKKLNYIRRMAWYRTGLRAILGIDTEQVMLAVGKTYRTAAVYRVPEIDLDAAEEQNREALRRYAGGDEWAPWEMEINDL
jgi:exodeoxyribonuclease VIII